MAEPDLSLRSAWLPDRTGVAQLTITQKLEPAALSRREGDTGHWSPPSPVQIWRKRWMEWEVVGEGRRGRELGPG